jgi:putative ABC transport system permease protein
VTTVQKKIVGIDHVGYIRVKVNTEENVDPATDEITNLLRDRHNIDRPEEDDFTVSNVANALEILSTITSALQLFLVAIAGIALIVGGIGIMNIMLAAVTERIREIGLRKAVGATKSNIIRQFLIETIMISVCGAIIGILLGVGISWLVAVIVRGLDYDWDWVVSIQSILFAVTFSVIIGLIFGVYPAKKAANLDPIKALHYE